MYFYDNRPVKGTLEKKDGLVRVLFNDNLKPVYEDMAFGEWESLRRKEKVENPAHERMQNFLSSHENISKQILDILTTHNVRMNEIDGLFSAISNKTNELISATSSAIYGVDNHLEITLGHLLEKIDKKKLKKMEELLNPFEKDVFEAMKKHPDTRIPWIENKSVFQGLVNFVTDILSEGIEKEVGTPRYALRVSNIIDTLEKKPKEKPPVDPIPQT